MKWVIKIISQVDIDILIHKTNNKRNFMKFKMEKSYLKKSSSYNKHTAGVY